jgi:hypothetical protein
MGDPVVDRSYDSTSPASRSHCGDGRGEAFHVDAGKVHEAKASGGPAVVIANYVIEKGKPATTPVK